MGERVWGTPGGGTLWLLLQGERVPCKSLSGGQQKKLSGGPTIGHIYKNSLPPPGPQKKSYRAGRLFLYISEQIQQSTVTYTVQ